MKKVFYSEILKKYFDSEEECIKQELIEKSKNTINRKSISVEEQKAESRKQAAKVVESAERAVSEAYDELKKAEDKARIAYKEIVNPAKEKLQKAEKNRLEAIMGFNKKFGVYTKRYTGQEANDEFLRSLSHIEDLFNIFNL